MSNKITFGSVDSSTYDIYISGEGVFNAPERDVEIISIPGRNGSFLLDNGRFENIEVTYPAYNLVANNSTFVTKVDGLRNALASLKGYQRLEDTFHPNEYRMASFVSGLEVKPYMYNDHASHFDIVFNCKPQRFLKSGETATSYARNSTITNPTLFDAHPLIQFNSSGSDGSISLGTQTITVKSAYMGVIPLNLSASSTTVSGYDPAETVTINNTSSYNTGDTITVKGASAVFELHRSSAYTYAPTLSNANGLTGTAIRTRSTIITATLSATDTTFTAGTSSTVSKTIDIEIKISPSSTLTGTFTCQLVYNGSNTITVRWSVPTLSGISYMSKKSASNYSGTVDSTKNTLQNVTIYIDLDIGEAYSIDSSNNVVSLNNYVNIGGELPVLPPGNTTITYSNTVSNFKITPRWWKI